MYICISMVHIYEQKAISNVIFLPAHNVISNSCFFTRGLLFVHRHDVNKSCFSDFCRALVLCVRMHVRVFTSGSVLTALPNTLLVWFGHVTRHDTYPSGGNRRRDVQRKNWLANLKELTGRSCSLPTSQAYGTTLVSCSLPIPPSTSYDK